MRGFGSVAAYERATAHSRAWGPTAATYFGGQEPTGQINFRKKLAKTLIFNTHYNEDDDKTPDKKRKQ